MPPETPPDLSRLTRSHRQLVAELGHLRALAGGGLRPFGAKAGMSYTRVRRIETGQVMPSLPEVRAWLAAAGVADEATADRLVALAETAHTSTSRWSTVLPDGPGRHLNHIAAGWEETSTLICSYQQMIVPGLLATAGYARALIPHLPVAVDQEAHLAGQMRRQDVLHAETHQFRFLLTARAWTWSPDPSDRALMVAQHDRIRRVNDLPAVEVRLLDDDAAPMGGYSSFTIYDERDNEPPLVVVEVEKGSTTFREPAGVEHYRRRYTQMWDAARPVSDTGDLPPSGPE